MTGVSRIFLHPGLHGEEARSLVDEAWSGESLVVFCPARIRSFAFLESLPEGPIECVGDWSGRALPPVFPRRRMTFPERPLFGVFTSGTSSGAPQLVLYSRRNLEASARAILSLFDASRLSTIFCYPQPSHAFGLVLGYVLCRMGGYRLLTGEGRYDSSFHALRLACDEPGLLTLGAPTHFEDLLTFAHDRSIRPAPSYAAVIGGARVTVSLWRKLKDELRIEAPSIGYGGTEASPGITHLAPGIEPREDGEIGRVLPGVEVELTPSGLKFRGNNVALAIAGGTGVALPSEWTLSDNVIRRPDGRLVFCGRIGAWLNRGGEKFPLERIEAVLSRATGHSLLCVAIPAPRLGEELGVLLEGAMPPPETIPELHRTLEEEFGCGFSGAVWKAAPRLPCNESGKPDRAAAVALFTERMGARFPLATEALATHVPHRPPMVWINRVLEADERSGKASLRFQPEALYASPRGLRRSSLVELMAQTYAFSRASLASEGTVPRKAYLAAMSAIEFAGQVPALSAGDELTVNVRLLRELGPLSLVEAEVMAPGGRLLAKGHLKLYAEP